MSRYTGPCRIRIHGPQGAGAAYVGLARTLLGEQMGIHVEAYDSSRGLASQSHVSKTYTPKPTEQIQRRVSLPNGVSVRVQYNTHVPVIDIWVPEDIDERDNIEFRGLLRALQDANQYCDPLEGSIGNPGEDGYFPGQFSELHPLYDPEDEEQQWLTYPGLGSSEFNVHPNHPLPPTGGTFVMDMIGEPFIRQAFTHGDYDSCKMLLTGGGVQTNTLGYYASGTFIDGFSVVNCPPRKFRVGRRDELLGWPWNGPGAPRLISLSATLRRPGAGSINKAEFKIEFLKLNNEPFDGNDENYLEPIEFEAVLDQTNIASTSHPYSSTFWVDFSVLSLTPDGGKAIIGLHQRGDVARVGLHYDFVILDIQKIIEDPEDFIFFSRLDTYNGGGTVSDSHSGQLTELALVYQDPDPDISFPPDIDELAGNFTDADLMRVKYVDQAPDETVYPTQRSRTSNGVFDTCLYMYFVGDDVYEIYTKVGTSGSTTETQTLNELNYSPPDPDDEKGHVGYRYIRVRNWQADTFYERGTVITRREGFTIIGGPNRTLDNVFVTLEDHTSTNENRPGLELVDNNLVDRSGSAWKMVWGDRLDGQGCQFATWNGLDPADPSEYNALSVCNTSGWRNICLGEGGTTTRLWGRSTIGAPLFRQEIGTTSTSTSDRYVEFYRRKLDLDAGSVFEGRNTEEDDFILSVDMQSSSSSTKKRELRNHFECLEFAPCCGYRALTRTASSSKESYYIVDSASEDVIANSGVDYAIPDYSPIFSYQGDGWPPGQLIYQSPAPLFLPYNLGITKFEIFSDAGIFIAFPRLPIFPVSGIGWLIAVGQRGASGQFVSPADPSANLSFTSYGSQRNKCILTVSGAVLTGADEHNPFEAHSVLTGFRPDLVEVPAITHPLPYGEDGEVLLEIVRGSEKLVTCKDQQIAYVGWLYPEETRPPED